MPIKEPLLFISIEDFKNWKGFDKLLFENVTNSNENIWFAISIASSNIDYLSGFAISKKWPEQTITTFTDNVQTATAHYVRFLCTKGVDYTRGQASMAQGGIVYSESNPNDPYYIPPEVFNYLRNINEYTAFQGFNLDVKPKTNFFSKFLSNKGESNPLENYLQITNVISSNKSITIKQEHPVNIMGTVLDITTNSGLEVDDNSFNLTNNKLFLEDTKVFNRFTTDLQNTNFDSLVTTNKTLIGAINEINAKITPSTGTKNTFDFYFQITQIDATTPGNAVNRLFGKFILTQKPIVNLYTFSSRNLAEEYIATMAYEKLGTSFFVHDTSLPNQTTWLSLNGVWTNGTKLISRLRGIKTEEKTNQYIIYFQDGSDTPATLTLDVTPIVTVNPSDITPSMAPIMPQIDSSTYVPDPESFKTDSGWLKLQDELVKKRFGVDNKQNINDDNLKTIDKTIVGATNELKDEIIKERLRINQVYELCKKIEVWKEVGKKIDGDKLIDYVFVVGKKYRLYYTFQLDNIGYIYNELVFTYYRDLIDENSHRLLEDVNGSIFIEHFEGQNCTISVTSGAVLKLEELQ